MNIIFLSLFLFTGTEYYDSKSEISINAIKYITDSSINKHHQLSDTLIISDIDTTLNFSKGLALTLINQQTKQSTDYFNYIFPIITLLLGIGINRFLDSLSKKKKLKQVLKRWIAELRILVDPLSEQVDNLDRFVAEVKEEKNHIPDMGVHTVLKGEIFKTLDKGEFLDSIEKINRVKYQKAVHLANRTHGLTQALSYYSELLQNQFEDYKSRVSQIIDELNENNYRLKKAYGNYFLDIEKTEEGDPIQDEAYSIIGGLILENLIRPSVQEKPLKDIFQLEKDFFTPLLVTLSKHRLDERTSEILEITSNCLKNINSLRSEKEIISKYIMQIMEEFKIQSETIQSVINSLDKRK